MGPASARLGSVPCRPAVAVALVPARPGTFREARARGSAPGPGLEPAPLSSSARGQLPPGRCLAGRLPPSFGPLLLIQRPTAAALSHRPPPRPGTPPVSSGPRPHRALSLCPFVPGFLPRNLSSLGKGPPAVTPRSPAWQGSGNVSGMKGRWGPPQPFPAAAFSISARTERMSAPTAWAAAAPRCFWGSRDVKEPRVSKPGFPQDCFQHNPLGTDVRSKEPPTDLRVTAIYFLT